MKKHLSLTVFALLLTVALYAVGPITGITTGCVGGTRVLADTTAGGTWSSSNTAIASMNPTSGLVYCLAAGTVTISYVTGSGTATTSFTVNNVPAAIGGPSAVCAGSSITLTNATTGGIWQSGNVTRAIVDSLSGIVTGVSAGSVNIYYSVGGCGVFRAITVNPTPAAIGGPSSVCVGATIVQTDATSGGVWSSSAASIASINASTGVLTGVSAGTANITYALGTGCAAYRSVVVNNTPSAISGPSTLCPGTSITLTNATTGGIWLSSNPSIASIDSTSGVLTGRYPGTVNIYYSVGGCAVSYTVTVSTGPSAISGPTNICYGSAVTLIDSVSGGFWTSSNTSIATVVSGVVTGVGLGTATITYTIGSCIATHNVTVISAPATITGPTSVCVGSAITLANATTGGTWSSGTTSMATVNATSGVVYGVSAGTLNIYYAIGTCGTFHTVTVNAAPSAIMGSAGVCIGSSVTLTNATTGGTWTSSNAAIASVNATTGAVSGIALGSATIYYTVGGCSVARTITVSAAPAAIAGPTGVCTGSTVTLTNTTTGGTWTSSNSAIASIGITSGIVSGIASGTSTIYYTVGGCNVSRSINVAPPPAAIGGPATVCRGNTITLTNATSGGTWSSSNTFYASVTSSGIVTGNYPGSVNILYTVGGCSVAHGVTVLPVPSAIWGSTSVCTGSTTTLHDSLTGGVWLSGNTTIATIDSSTGEVTGVAAGVVNIYYSVGGCATYMTLTVSTCYGYLSGSISTGGAKATAGSIPVAGMLVKLKDASTSATLDETYTDAAGLYSFTGIGFNTYFIYPERVGYTTVPSSNYTLASSSASASGVNFIVSNTSMTITPGTTSIAELTNSGTFLVFPNPTNGELNISWNNNTDDDAVVLVADVMGQVVLRTKLITGTNTGNSIINLNELAGGTYLIIVQNSSTYFSGKLTIQR